MRTTSNKTKIFIGRRGGGEILKEIGKARKSVKIVSPYLSPSYLEELVRLTGKGVKITLITADKLAEGDGRFSKFKHKDIIKQNKILNPELKDKKKSRIYYTGVIFILSLACFALSLLIPSFLYFSLILLVSGIVFLFLYLVIKPYSYEYYSLFRLKVFDSHSGKNPQSNNLIHSKIFLIDDSILFLGSANFTFSAFNTHYETIIKIEDEKAIRDIDREIEDLYNSTDLKSKPIDEWGREIYGGFFSSDLTKILKSSDFNQI